MHRSHPHPNAGCRKTPNPTAKPHSLSTHSQTPLNAMAAQHMEPRHRSRSTQTPRPDNPCQTATDLPRRPRPPHPHPRTAQPKPTETPRASRDAPEPDSQSLKTTTQQTAQHPAPPNGSDNAHATRTSSLSVTTHPSQTATPWRRTGSNRRPPACKAGALPTELRPHTQNTHRATHRSRPKHDGPKRGRPKRGRPKRGGPQRGGPGRTRTSDPTLIKRVL